MKSNKGITLTSLIIYVIGLTIMVATIATLTTFFYKNIDAGDINNDKTQYTKFSSVFSNEINRKNNRVLDCKTLENDEAEESYIIFSSGNQYTYNKKSKSIYKNSSKVCDNVEKCSFSYIYEDSKFKITVEFKTANINMTGENSIIYIIR